MGLSEFKFNYYYNNFDIIISMVDKWSFLIDTLFLIDHWNKQEGGLTM